MTVNKMLKNWIESIIRPQIKGFEPYLPGRSMVSVKRELGLKNIIKLASNENALGPSAKALAAIRKVGKKLLLYPDGASVSLRMTLAKKAGVTPDHVIIGEGSDELIEILGKTFLNPGDSIVVSEHAFIRYRMAGELMGADIITVPMRNFTHDLAAMALAVRDNTKIVFIANPNNPTGTYNTHEQLVQLLEQLRKRHPSPPPSPLSEGRGSKGEGSRPLVVVDEAYYEYAKTLQSDYPNTLSLQKEFPNLVILRTFSKAHALAGLRVGYGFADAEVIGALDRVRPPFNVSTLGQAGAEASLGDPSHIKKAVQLVIAERKKTLPALAKMGLSVIPSAGNFVLIDVSPRRGKDLFESLMKRGIIVRSMDEYGFPNHIRVTYGLPNENLAFLKALKAVIPAKAGIHGFPPSRE